jgi:lysophospholipase L1-like esterase
LFNLNAMIRSILALLFFILFLSCSPLKIYRELPEVKGWENDIRKFEQLDSLEIYPEDAILFTGSSSILLWSTLSSDMAPYPVIQRGYGGARLSDFAVYVKRIIYPHPCKAIVIFIANDISGGKEDKKPNEVARLFNYILKTIREKYPETPVFWIAITPTALRWDVWPQIREANTRIKKVCEKNRNTYFIQTDYAFLNASAQPKEELFLPDKLHLNTEGYAIWTEIIKKELGRVLQE